MVGSRASSRQGLRFAAVAVLALLLVPAAEADRRDQRAADLYLEGVKLIRQGRYREGAAKVNAALSRGATEPVEAQGSETRFLARPYDPYYWLGVAQMETGLAEQALANFEKSSTLVPKGRAQPVLADAPAEWADLTRRKALLLSRLEVPTPVAVAAATPAPLATPTPFVIRRPEREPAPTALPALAAVPPAAARPTVVPLPASVVALREDLSRLLVEPTVSLRAEGAVPALLDRLERACRRGPEAARETEAAVRRELAGEADAPLLRAALEAALEAHRGRRFEEAARLAGVVARLVPTAAQPELLRAVSLGTRWLLEGEARAGLEAEARAAYAAWRARRPAGLPPPRFLSPTLRERFEASGTTRSRG